MKYTYASIFDLIILFLLLMLLFFATLFLLEAVSLLIVVNVDLFLEKVESIHIVHSFQHLLLFIVPAFVLLFFK